LTLSTYRYKRKQSKRLETPYNGAKKATVSGGLDVLTYTFFLWLTFN